LSLTAGAGLLIRRRKARPHQFTFYLTRALEETPLADLVRVPGQRWRIESCFEKAKGETGLDDYEVHSWTGKHRHVTLSMLAHAYLTLVRQQVIGGRGLRKARRGAAAHRAGGRRLLWHLVWERPPSVEAVEQWSVYRRHHQRTRECHWRNRTRCRPKSRL
jgi:hypothetical protein